LLFDNFTEGELELEWEVLETFQEPRPRFGHSMSTVGDTLYLFGGDDLVTASYLDDLWALNTGKCQ
jgi:hypothetical protein